MNFISLFSGIGGFDLGFEDAGMECAVQVEIDDAARSVLDRHFPGARKIKDVREFSYETSSKGSVDLICGGFPCQDVSVAGKRAGLAGERSGLWWEFARIIDEREPGLVVIENVPGLLSSCGCATCGAVRRILRVHGYLRRKRNIHKQCPVCIAGKRMLESHKGRDFAKVIFWLVQRGYGVSWRILDAQYFGVPQRRRRVFIVASFGDGRSAEILFESESVPGDPPASGKPGEEVAFTLRADPSHSGDKGDGGINCTLVARPLRAQAQLAHREDVDTLVFGFNHKASSGRSMPILEDQIPTLETGHNSMAIAFDGRNLDEHDVSPTLQAKKDGYSLNYTPMVFQQNTRDEVRFINGDGQIAGALAAQAGMKQQNYVSIAPTLDTNYYDKYGNNQQFQKNHGDAFPVDSQGVRRLTPVECERLQGFPDGWTGGAK